MEIRDISGFGRLDGQYFEEFRRRCCSCESTTKSKLSFWIRLAIAYRQQRVLDNIFFDQIFVIIDACFEDTVHIRR